jgi:hypothetical protein
MPIVAGLLAAAYIFSAGLFGVQSTKEIIKDIKYKKEIKKQLQQKKNAFVVDSLKIK